jgi:hypothetical protein
VVGLRHVAAPNIASREIEAVAARNTLIPPACRLRRSAGPGRRTIPHM